MVTWAIQSGSNGYPVLVAENSWMCWLFPWCCSSRTKMFHNGTPTFSKQGFSPVFLNTVRTYTSVVIHKFVWNSNAQNYFTVLFLVSAFKLSIAQKLIQVKPTCKLESNAVVALKASSLPFSVSYWHRRCSNSDGQRVSKAASTPWSSHWPYIKPFHSLLALKLICRIQTCSLELFGEDVFLIIYLLKTIKATSWWPDIFK